MAGPDPAAVAVGAVVLVPGAAGLPVPVAVGAGVAVVDGGDGSGGVRVHPRATQDVVRTPNAAMDDSTASEREGRGSLIAADFRTAPRALSPRHVQPQTKLGTKKRHRVRARGGESLNAVPSALEANFVPFLSPRKLALAAARSFQKGKARNAALQESPD
jgi:hypothetical protein